jgi:hypothetical protein
LAWQPSSFIDLLFGVDVLAAVLAYTGSAPIGQNLVAHARGFVTLRANQHHVRDVQWRFPLNDPELRADIPCATLMLLDEIDACHNNPGGIGIRAWMTSGAIAGDYPLHFAAGALIVTADDFNRIALLDIHLQAPEVGKAFAAGKVIRFRRL